MASVGLSHCDIYMKTLEKFYKDKVPILKKSTITKEIREKKPSNCVKN